MKKVILLLLVFLTVVISQVWAVETLLPYNASMVYNVTVNKVEVYNSTTGQWVSVTSTPTTFNIASAAAANTVVGNMISGVTLPNGTYTRLKWEVSNTFGIKACETGTGVCTNGTQQAHLTHNFSAVAALTYTTASTTTTSFDFTAADACPVNTTTITHTCAAASLTGDEVITSFVIGSGSSANITANITFDVNNVMKHYSANHFGPGSAEMIWPGEPSVSVTFE
ncbi:MAG: hypothetical protein QMD07_04815 [Thermodesulfovibrionales bacterium]|nr:hypothetical protein [Thermodesulfovibrionales bacterium]